MDLPNGRASRDDAGLSPMKGRLWEGVLMTRYTRSLRWIFPMMRLKIAALLRRQPAGQLNSGR